jgi:putative oxidoreductase
MTSLDLGALILRVAVGYTIFLHGWNHVRRGSLPGTASWFGSIGMRQPMLNAVLASATELIAGPLLVAGLLTPFAAAAVVGTMFVALIANHLRNGFFIFRPGEGYEYVVMILLVSLAIGALGGGRWSLDNAIGLDLDGWPGLLIAAGLGIGTGALVLISFWRPGEKAKAA